MEPLWYVEALLVLCMSVILYIGITDTCWYRAIILLTLTQIMAGWIGHSMNHNRHYLMWKYSPWSGIFSGLSSKWWGFKHNNHHMFTNRVGKDDDINHNYAAW